MKVNQVQHCWNQALEECSIPEVAPAPLLNPDASVLIVNAGITVFKQVMLSGANLPTTAITQPCIRTHWNSDGLFMFSMLTAVGSVDQMDVGMKLVTRFLAALSLHIDHYICVVDDRDEDVTTRARELGTSVEIEFQHGNTDAYWTRWQFGSGAELEGRGLTLVALDRNGQRYSLGNIIIVHHEPSRRDYFDIGFGLERIVSLFHNGDYWAGSHWKASIDAVTALGYSDAQTRRIANHLIAIHKLIAEGADPAPKGAGYLTRKLIRQAVDLVMAQDASNTSPDATINRLMKASAIFNAAAGLDAHETVVNHVQAYISGIDRTLQMAAKAARKQGIAVRDLDLSGTYGIPSWALPGAP